MFFVTLRYSMALGNLKVTCWYQYADERQIQNSGCNNFVLTDFSDFEIANYFGHKHTKRI